MNNVLKGWLVDNTIITENKVVLGVSTETGCILVLSPM